jgi:hypothetical protein
MIVMREERMTKWVTDNLPLFQDTLPVWAALTGALIGAAMAFGLREWADRRQRKKELIGLLRLLDVETYINHNVMRGFQVSHELRANRKYSLLVNAWDDTRIQLARLLKSTEQFADITFYYERVRAIEERRQQDIQERVRLSSSIFEQDRTLAESNVGAIGKDELDVLLDLSETVRGHIRKHVPDSTRGTGTLPGKNEKPPHTSGS